MAGRSFDAARFADWAPAFAGVTIPEGRTAARHGERREAIQSPARDTLDCFAALAMTGLAETA